MEGASKQQEVYTGVEGQWLVDNHGAMEKYILGRFPMAFRRRFNASAGSTWFSLAGSLHLSPHLITGALQGSSTLVAILHHSPLHTFAQATPSAGNKFRPLSTWPIPLTLPSSAQSHSWEACLHLPGGARCLGSCVVSPGLLVPSPPPTFQLRTKSGIYF